MARKAKKTKKKARTSKKKTVVIPRSFGKAIEKSLTVRKPDYDGRKLRLVLGNLMFFVIIFVVSSLLYTVSATEFYKSLFFMLSFIFGIFSVTLMVVLLIFVLLRVVNNK